MDSTSPRKRRNRSKSVCEEQAGVDTLSFIVIAAIAAIALYRLLYTYRKAKLNRDRGDRIQRELERLRKKRDED